MKTGFATFVHVILPLSLPKLYTYRVPAELEMDIAVGKRVVVQFGKKILYTAIVQEISDHPPAGYEAKYILSVLDEHSLVSPQLLRFWNWMSSYYMCSVGDVMKAALPAPLKPESETRVSLNEECDLQTIELSDKEYLVVEALTVQKELTLDEVSDIVRVKNVFPLLKGLYVKGAILLSEEMERDWRPKKMACIGLAPLYREEKELELLFAKLEKQPKQLDVLMAWLHLKNELEHISKARLKEVSRAGDSSIKTLVKNGILTEYSIEISRLPFKSTTPLSFDLNEQQREAYQALQTIFRTKDVALLHGITSSGKTHVYVKMMEDVLTAGKQVLLLLPEIALTSQIVSRIRKFFGENAIAFHSGFSQNERVELWKRINQGEAKIIIGARSAVFLPFTNLGLVIVDEEHENSYKQQEPAPRYHARDAAIFLAHIWQCKTVLGSATPSLESYFNATTGKYGLVEMHTRFGNSELPSIITANIAEETRTKTIKGNFTSVLFEEIEKALVRHEQVIIFQNRRGYAPLLECQVCRWIPKCINCDISLTYHKSSDMLRCHYCGHSREQPKHCAACGSHLLQLKGTGTEKVEDEIMALFPEARISRLDLDTTRTKNALDEIIRGFENSEADILVGTQMVSKGLDFGKVSVVGIINADQLLHFPDFRAHERTYQLISQVSGRAGRRESGGKVVVQTSSPENRIIQNILRHEYQLMYANECDERRKFEYPPYFRLIRIVVKHKDFKTAAETAWELKTMLDTRLADKLIGPESPYVSRIRNLFIKEMLVKVDRNNQHISDIKNFIKAAIAQILSLKTSKGSIIYADVDPY